MNSKEVILREYLTAILNAFTLDEAKELADKGLSESAKSVGTPPVFMKALDEEGN